MDNSKLLNEVLNDDPRNSNPGGDLPGVPVVDDAAAFDAYAPFMDDPTGSLVVASLVVICATLSGFALGYWLGPSLSNLWLAWGQWMVMR